MLTTSSKTMILILVLLFPYALRLYRRFFRPRHIDHWHLAVNVIQIREVVVPVEPVEPVDPFELVVPRAEDALWAEDAEGGGWDERRWGGDDLD